MTNLRSPNTVHRKYVSCGDGDVMGGTMQNFDITAKRAARRLSVRCSARSIVHGCVAYLNVDRNVPSIEKANRVAAVEMEIASRSSTNHIIRRQRPPDPLQLELADRLDLHGVLDLY